MKIKKTVYTKSFEDAQANGEVNRYHESYKLNGECAAAIYQAIVDSNYEPNHYNLKSAAQKVMGDYGEKRVLWVLAATVQRSFNDGRYSSQNHKWAKEFYIPFLKGSYPTVRSHPVLVDGFIDYARKICAERQQEVKQARAAKRSAASEQSTEKTTKPDIELTAFAKEEFDLFYANDGGPERDEKFGYIGRLRGDFGRSGNEFWTTWADSYADLKTQAFHAEFNSIINSLRESGVLKDFISMSSHCYKHPQAQLSEGGTHYGFRIKTDAHVFYLRLGTMKGDYNFYCYAHERSRLEKHFPALRDETKPSLMEKLEENKRKVDKHTRTEPRKKNELEV